MTASRRTRSGRPSTPCSGPPESAWEGAATAPTRICAGRAAAARPGSGAICCCRGCTRVNDRVGWISEGALDYLCRRLTVPPAEAYGVATFYSMFSVQAAPRDGGARLHGPGVRGGRGARELCAGVEAPARASAAGWRVGASPCLGLCERAPAALAVRAGDPVRTAVSAPATVRATPSSPRSPARTSRARGAAGGAGRPPGRRPAPDAAAPGRRGGPRVAWTTTARTAATPPCAGPSTSAPPESSARSPTPAWSGGAAPPSPPAASGRPRRPSPTTRTTWSATPTSPSRAPSRTA